ncbi:MAG: adenosylhomocysteinase [Pseudomonadota bacterium]
MDTLDKDRVSNFFNEACQAFPINQNVASIIVTHILPDRPFLLEALSRQTDLACVLAKPKSVHSKTKDWLSKSYPIEILRQKFLDGPKTLEFINKKAKSQPLVLMDIGGYFSNVIGYLYEHYNGDIIGVIEDTENGHQKYEKQQNKCPIISVARSPLKYPEDYMVGQSIVYSTEALLREQGDIIHGRTACVIGYGKLGRSIANLLHARHVRTVVYDINAIKVIEAMSHGFAVAKSLESALMESGLVFCATGNIALEKSGFDHVQPGAYIATVTSSDDELRLDDLSDYHRKQVTDYITKYQKESHYFYLLNRGQAVNFIHGAAVGPFIYLVQAEILASIARCSNEGLEGGMIENNSDLRAKIASIWLDHFSPSFAK